MEIINSKKRLYIAYRGAKNPPLEELINKHLGPHGLHKAGQWGFNEGSFQCLFLYKKESLLEQFKATLRRELGLDFSRLVFLPH